MRIFALAARVSGLFPNALRFVCCNSACGCACSAFGLFSEVSMFYPSFEHHFVVLIPFLNFLTAHAQKRFCTGLADGLFTDIAMLLPKRQFFGVEILLVQALVTLRALYSLCFTSHADCVSESVTMFFPSFAHHFVERIPWFYCLTAYAQKRFC